MTIALSPGIGVIQVLLYIGLPVAMIILGRSQYIMSLLPITMHRYELEASLMSVFNLALLLAIAISCVDDLVAKEPTMPSSAYAVAE